MKKEDIVFGMKVIPHDKSVWCELSESCQWRNAQEKDQKYLYVSNFDEEEDAWVLCFEYPVLNSDEFYDGDFFSVNDFEPYCE